MRRNLETRIAELERAAERLNPAPFPLLRVEGVVEPTREQVAAFSAAYPNGDGPPCLDIHFTDEAGYSGKTELKRRKAK
jgi:hypothetical protein